MNVITAFKQLHPYWFVSLFVLVVISITTIASNRIEQQAQSQVGNSLESVLMSTREGLHLWIGPRLRDASELAASPDILTASKALLEQHMHGGTLVPSPALVKLQNKMAPRLANRGDHGFFIIAPDRTSIASSRNINIGSINVIQVWRPDYLDKVFSGETVFIPSLTSDIALSPEDDNLPHRPVSIFVAAPIIDQGKVIAALSLRLDPKAEFSAHIRLGRLGKTGETYAFDRHGILITESRSDQQLRDIKLIPEAGKGILSIRIADPGGNLLDGYRPPLRPAVRPLTRMAASATQGHKGVDVKGYRDYRGVTVQGAWLWDTRLGIGLTTEVDLADAMASFYQARNTLITVAAIIIALAMILVTLMVHRYRHDNREAHIINELLETRVERRTQELNETRDQLQAANRELHIIAHTDALTGLANRRLFDSRLKLTWRHCRREHRGLGLILFDIDFFKAYNDYYGHPHGDFCLQQIAHTLNKTLALKRPGDLLARYDGEEFVIVLADPKPEHVENVANRVREGIFAAQIEHRATYLDHLDVLTASVGYAHSQEVGDLNPQQLIAAADQALYNAKQQGRNRVVAAAAV